MKLSFQTLPRQLSKSNKNWNFISKFTKKTSFSTTYEFLLKKKRVSVLLTHDRTARFIYLVVCTLTDELGVYTALHSNKRKWPLSAWTRRLNLFISAAERLNEALAGAFALYCVPFISFWARLAVASVSRDPGSQTKASQSTSLHWSLFPLYSVSYVTRNKSNARVHTIKTPVSPYFT